MAGATTGTAFYDPNEILGSQKLVNDSMATQVTNLSAKDSPLNQMARTEGLKAANRRGMLNSSMAIGASQDAVLRNIMPIAAQDSAQAFAKNQAAKAFEYGLTGQVQQQGWQTGERLGAEKFQTGERLGAQGWQSAENLLQRKFVATQADLDRDLQELMQKRQIGSTEKMQIKQIASTEGMAKASNALQKLLFEKDIQFRMSEGKLNRAAAVAAQAAEIKFNREQGAAGRALQEKIAKMNLSGTQQAGAAQFITNMSTMYQAQYSSIMSNPDLDAATREKFLKAAKQQYDTGLNLVEQMYDINLKWA